MSTTGGRSDHRGEIRRDSAELHAAVQQRIMHHKLSWIGVMDAQPFSTSDPQFKRAIDMTDDELAAIASGATLHVVK